jgi:hypothetical protein
MPVPAGALGDGAGALAIDGNDVAVFVTLRRAQDPRPHIRCNNVVTSSGSVITASASRANRNQIVITSHKAAPMPIAPQKDAVRRGPTGRVRLLGSCGPRRKGADRSEPSDPLAWSERTTQRRVAPVAEGGGSFRG